MHLRADEIELDFAPSRRADIASTAIGTEVVVVAASGGRAHVLNDIAAMLWRFLDGRTTIRELADDLRATGAEADVVLSFVRNLGELELLDSVIPTAAVWPAGSVEPGQRVPKTEGRDARDGSPIMVPPPRRSAIVHWSATCGFCDALAPSLRQLLEPLQKAGIDVVLVANGDGDANLANVRDHGLSSPVAVFADQWPPFAGFGTPVAYLVDCAGNVEEPLAIGGDAIARLIEGALGGIPSKSDVERRYLPIVGGVCAPGAIRANRTEWVGRAAYAFGSSIGGIRHASPEAGAIVRRLLSESWIDDPRAPDNYGVVLGGDSRSGRADLGLLVRGSDQVVRTRSRAAILDALLRYLSDDVYGPAPAGIATSLVTAIRGRRAVLLPREVMALAKSLLPRLSRDGIAIVPGGYSVVDPELDEIIVPPIRVAHDEDLLQSLTAGDLDHSQCVTSGGYSLAAVFARADANVPGISPAVGLAAMAAAVPSVDVAELRGAAAALRSMIERVATLPLVMDSPAMIAGAISDSL